MKTAWVLALTLPLFSAAEPRSLPDLQKAASRLAPVALSVDLSKVPKEEQRALGKLVQAAQVMDALFLRQTWAGSETLLASLAADTSPLGQARLASFMLHKGPWDRLDEGKPFLLGVPEARPGGGNFYPPGATKAEVEKWLATLSAQEKLYATAFFTTVRRDATGKFTWVPYNVEYQAELHEAARLLREAAGLTLQPTLKAYLEKRAAAFLSNDYYASDVAWMELDASIEPTVGPYEVYEDGWFNAKAAFEAFITMRDDVETAKLQKFSAQLQDIEDHLPVDPKYRNPRLGALSPIRVVNSLFSAGDGNRGVQTAAYNLPNDERVAAEKGTKRTMLKNVQEAKFKLVLQPVAKVVLSYWDKFSPTFDAFFTHILMHELMHGLGPHNITVNGQATTVRAQLQDTYSAIEEAKADISGLWALQYLIDKGELPKTLEKPLYATYLTSCFRSIRFGLHEAHGKGVALQLNTLLDAGAVKIAYDGSFSTDPAKVKDAVRALTTELLTLQATGDREKARKLLSERAVIRPRVKAMLDKLDKVPVDIAPRYVTAEKLLQQP
ncbi:MAG: hypothetical protein FJ086_11545 [Deltaproteobacteria bacterium]|nr:hypothetical protein [Deltaproteobacteria bacterium]